ncbi:prolyl 4-hydroxylase subunit alpha-1-like [Ceratitis capitata]|uniref:prolyl 4-hydroxylase subunit alpha-1-like n=1 Tax=Ceratitis capitata TaxID=7213 RepID=UPI0003296DC8|nr:prolyl 4-hydroxylase subunit alpha-1-like [Ceratitis capitata]
MMYLVQILCLLFVIRCGVSENDENFDSLTTSVAGLEQLIETEFILIQNLEYYADELQDKLYIIRSLVTNLREENNKARQNPGYYVSIPTNVLSLVRRLQKDWVYLDIYMKQSVGEKQIKALHEHWSHLPQPGDVDEAVKAISRLQDTYELQAADLADGLINGKKYDTKLTTLDCYTMGYELFNQNDYIKAGYWLYAATQLYEDDVMLRLHDLSNAKIMELYAETLLRQMRYQDALSVMKVVQALPSTPATNSQLLRKINEVDLHIKTYNPRVVPHPKREPTDYERGCRGEFTTHNTKFYCIYNKTTTAFLKLAPLKMEIISLDPYLVIFHDVMSDGEIRSLQEMAKPILRRATVYNEERKRSEVVSRRTSKFAWFYDHTNEITERINKRIEDMTGFDLDGSEMLQVMNYGLGGHYDTHFDFFNVSMTADIVAMQGDRKATVLFYMTDVDQGGATVFPNIQTAVFPKKGTAVMWYNLNNRFQGDYKTLHAGCPVLVGSKWVTNKWVRERNQMFRLPCYKEQS